MNTPPGAADQRIAAIDGLRALAVALVLGHHMYSRGVPGGFIGVDIFFVISGFVITGALLRQNLDLRQFYIHRFFRIIPATLPVLAFALAGAAFGVPLAEPKDALLALLSLINWARAFELRGGDDITHFWSLAVEEQFYLVWPLVLTLIMRARASVVPIICAIIAGGLAWQIGMHLTGASYPRVYNGTDTRFSQLMMGCLLYFIIQKVRVPGWAGLAALAVLLVLAFTIRPSSAFYLTAGIGIIGGLSAVLVGALASNGGASKAEAGGTESWWHRPFLWGPVQWAGSRSYAIYLWHLPLLSAVKPLGLGQAGGSALAVVLTGLAAEASMRAVEGPARRVRARFDSAPPAQLPA